ncbi:hypothetical protein LguiA_019258 [Lonicera macranthoides]
MAEPNEEKPKPSTSSSSPQGDYHQIVKQKPSVEIITSWIDYAVEQAELAQKNIKDNVESAISLTRSRLSEIRSTSSAHLNQSIVSNTYLTSFNFCLVAEKIKRKGGVEPYDSLQDVKSEVNVYEDIVFGKIKEGVLLAASHPLITSGVVIGSGLLVLKRPRRFLYYKTLRLFASEEALLSKADAKVAGLRESIKLLKAESEGLEKYAVEAEEEMRRGRTKLRQAGKQIQGVVRSAYKIEKQAAGLKDILKELPSRESSRFRSQVSKLASEAKRERNTLAKEVTKISNYGISV